MRSNHVRTIALAAMCTFAACSDPIAPQVLAVAGNLETPSFELGPGHSYRIFLTLNVNGTYTREGRSYGAYPGQRADELSSYFRIDGTLMLRNDSLFFAATRMLSWDRFYGPNSPEEETKFKPDDQSAERYGARFDVSDTTLVLHYLTYPAEAPVATTLSLRRVR